MSLTLDNARLIYGGTTTGAVFRFDFAIGGSAKTDGAARIRFA
jgi:hypothetical protein